LWFTSDPAQVGKLYTSQPMNIEELRYYCLSLPEVSEHFPFDETTLVFKVNNKMFALTDLEGSLSVNLKCDPEHAIELREQYPAVKPGYHMNKKHWNTVEIDGSISDTILKQWIEMSYGLIAKKKGK
jgi:predicted DNA-binding protein (MmcQ/YjbR family)